MIPDNGLLDILAAAAAATEPAAAREPESSMQTAPSATVIAATAKATSTISSSVASRPACSTLYHHEDTEARDSIIMNGIQQEEGEGNTPNVPTRRHKHDSDRSEGKDKRRHRRSSKDEDRARARNRDRDRNRDRTKDRHRDEKQKKKRRPHSFLNIPKNIQLQGVHRKSKNNDSIDNGGGKHPHDVGRAANSLTSSVSEFSSANNGTVEIGDWRDQFVCGDSQDYLKPSTSFVPSRDDANPETPRFVSSKRTTKEDDIQTYLSKVKSSATQEKEGGKTFLSKCLSGDKSKPANSNDEPTEFNAEGNGFISHGAVDENAGKVEGSAVAGGGTEEEVVVLDVVSLKSDLSDEVVMSSTVTSMPSAVDDHNTIPLSIGSYVDRSQEPDTLPNIHITTPNRCPSFVVKLYAVLSYHPELSHIITWLPHGRSWTILDPMEFEVNVIPKHFGSGVSLVSFTKRITNVWGFERLSMSTNNNDSDGVSNIDAAVSSPSKRNPKNNLLRKSYCHEYFLRGKPHLLKKMAPIADKKRKPFKIATDTTLTETDLETIGRKRPLPVNNDHPDDDQDESLIVMKMIDGFIMEHGPTTRLPVSLCHRRSLGRGRAKKKEQNSNTSGSVKVEAVAQAPTNYSTCGKSANRFNKADKDERATGKRALPADFGTGDRPFKLNKTAPSSSGAPDHATVKEANASSSDAATGHHSNQATATQTLTETLRALAANHTNISSLLQNQNSLNFSNIVAAMKNSPSNVANATTAKPDTGCFSNNCMTESIANAPASCPNSLQSPLNSGNIIQLQPTKMQSDSSLVLEYQKRPPQLQLTQNGGNNAPVNHVTSRQPAIHAAVTSIYGNGCDGNSRSVVNNSAPASDQAPFLQIQQDQVLRSSENATFTNGLQNQQTNLKGMANEYLLQPQAILPATTLPHYGNITQNDTSQQQMILFPGSAVPQSVTNNQSPQQNEIENASSLASLLHTLRASQRVLFNNSSQGSTNGNAFTFSQADSNNIDQSQIPQVLWNNHQDVQQNRSVNSADILNWIQQLQTTTQNVHNTEANRGGFQNSVFASSPPTILPKNDFQQPNQPNNDQQKGTEESLRNMIHRAFLAGIVLGSKSVSNNSGKLRCSSDSSLTTTSTFSSSQRKG